MNQSQLQKMIRRIIKKSAIPRATTPRRLPWRAFGTGFATVPASTCSAEQRLFDQPVARRDAGCRETPEYPYPGHRRNGATGKHAAQQEPDPKTWTGRSDASDPARRFG